MAVATSLLLVSLCRSRCSLTPQPSSAKLKYTPNLFSRGLAHCKVSVFCSNKSTEKKEKKKKNGRLEQTSRSASAEAVVKRRTRSDREFDMELVEHYGISGAHTPVMLGEVLEVFAASTLRSFVDCTLGAAGHSSAVNNAERGFSILNDGPLDMRMNFQGSLKAEDILNSWPEAEVGRILRDYGEESNWHCLQTKIVNARLCGGLHSTGELVDLVRSMTPKSAGRQGWIKTATRVFQALRIAVNDELQTLKDALNACFDCLSSGGRLAVISFHSLEDRIVKQTFLDIINREDEDRDKRYEGTQRNGNENEEAWIKQIIKGKNGTILTKRPLTPSEMEERLNRRSRSAKLRVIQKL
ncbi:PREDICTED: uncharacterized protein LOC104593820 isoform X2 [Nelumbo nucifera]|uniref:Ribosomal RNA small subunit methyltransferase H n=2 Tax=Nelumbo nucifera TaxID=4432 RepID=A0A822Z6U3_NELNU|nr:PREDICTED: uncharacterized protein LOC104593820 isoform X2 [Nelumbo nucifera]DAD38686.1 TPA_asm: hypothetical protein HUJ06_013008 [Nelumbo nucifera]